MQVNTTYNNTTKRGTKRNRYTNNSQYYNITMANGPSKRMKHEIDMLHKTQPLQQPQQQQVLRPAITEKPAMALTIKIPPVKQHNPNNSMNEENIMAYTVNTNTANWTISPGETRFDEPVPMNLKYGFTRISPQTISTGKTRRRRTASRKRRNNRR
jgi:hypothetical protein